MAEAIILLGGNLGNQESIQQKVTEIISEEIGEVKERSHLYKSCSWGYVSVNQFFNQVLVVSTSLLPKTLLTKILSIEKKVGGSVNKRGTDGSYLDRFVDIDILFYDLSTIQSNNLTIPHPLMQERKFVLTPLVELRPNLIHPILDKSIRLLLETCSDKGEVIKCETNEASFKVNKADFVDQLEVQ